MASYTLTLLAAKQYDIAPLQTTLQTQFSLPDLYVNGSPATDQIIVVTSRDLTSGEQTTLASIVAAYDGRLRRKRKPYDLYVALGALTGTQRSNIASNLFGGSPPLFTQDSGGDSPDLLVLWVLQQTGGLSTADKNTVKQAAAAIYCRDNPTYLVNPAFDSSINVAGDEIDV